MDEQMSTQNMYQLFSRLYYYIDITDVTDVTYSTHLYKNKKNSVTIIISKPHEQVNVTMNPGLFTTSRCFTQAIKRRKDLMLSCRDVSRLEKERQAVLSEMTMVNTIEYRVEYQILSTLHRENRLFMKEIKKKWWDHAK